MDPQQQFCLKWNSYSSNLAMTFSNLFKSDLLADVTLSCNGTIFKAHKLILAACSKKFADLFENTPTNGQCVVILEATTPDNMAALLEFMYKGEVHVSQEALNSFLKSAENLQVKGLSTEHGRLAAAQTQSHESLENSPTSRGRHHRNSVTGSGAGANSSSSSTASGNGDHSRGLTKQECDSLMHPSSSSLGGLSPYLPPIYRPMSYEPPRKRALRSPFTEQQEVTRGSVLRDGKSSSDSVSPQGKQYRPSSSASSTNLTEADTMQSERASPQSSRYDNHSPPSTTGANGNAANSSGCQDGDNLTPGRNSNGGSEGRGSSPNEANLYVKDERDSNDVRIKCESTTNSFAFEQNGAEDLRIKMENPNFSPPLTTSSTNNPPATTPTSILENIKNNEALPGGFAASIAPADMLNVWNATKLNNKNSMMMNTADGKKLKCLYCDRLYGYETNLRAHIRQRHQGIRVPCPFCSRTFTRNNTVRRHIAREHKQEIGVNQMQQAAAAAAGGGGAGNNGPIKQEIGVNQSIVPHSQ
ncbi:chinmo family protein [Megaselia abdita]